MKKLYLPVLVDVDADDPHRQIPGLEGLDALHHLGDLLIPGYGVPGAVVMSGEDDYTGAMPENRDDEIVLDVAQIGLHLVRQDPVRARLGDAVYMVDLEGLHDPIDHRELYAAVNAADGRRIALGHVRRRRKGASHKKA